MAEKVGQKQIVEGSECWSEGHWEPLGILGFIEIILASTFPLKF